MLPVFPEQLSNTNSADPHYNNVVVDIPGTISEPRYGYGVLLHFESNVNGSTQMISSGNSLENPIVVGNCYLDTSIKPFGNSSCRFDGSGDYLRFNDNTLYDLTGTAFTVQFWIRFADLPGSGVFQNIICKRSTPTSAFNYIIYASNSKITASFSTTGNGATHSITNTNNLVVDTWYHVAFVRSDGYVRMYIDGEETGTPINIGSTSFYNSGQYLYIGTGDTVINFFNGYLKDVAICYNKAFYTQNFTPPMHLLNSLNGIDTYDPYWYNTRFFLPGSGLQDTSYFIDDSVLFKPLVTNGNTKVSTSLVDYGALEFDGNGDYIAVATADGNFNIGTGDFTAEAWMYLYGPTPIADGNGNRAAYILRANDDTFHLLEITGNSTTTGTGFGAWNGSVWQGVVYSFSYLQWYHVAMSRVGGVARYYVNGVKISEQANAISYGDTSLALNIGGCSASSWNRYFYGQLKDIRLTLGIGRYIEDSFIPKERFFGHRQTFANVRKGGALKYTVGNSSLLAAQYAHSLQFITASQHHIVVTKPITLNDTWTVDFNVMANTFSGSPYLISFVNALSSPTNRWALQFNTSGLLQIFNSNGSSYVYSNFTAKTNRWYSISLQNKNGRIQIFVDGTIVADQVPTNSIPNITGYIEIGGAVFNASNFLDGYMNNIRITKDVARYVGNTLPNPGPYPNRMGIV